MASLIQKDKKNSISSQLVSNIFIKGGIFYENPLSIQVPVISWFWGDIALTKQSKTILMMFLTLSDRFSSRMWHVTWRRNILIPSVIFSSFSLQNIYNLFFFTDGNENQKDFRRWVISTKHLRRCQELFRAIRSCKYTSFPL